MTDTDTDHRKWREMISGNCNDSNGGTDNIYAEYESYNPGATSPSAAEFDHLHQK